MNHIERAYQNAFALDIDDYSRVVMISDCHRGYGGWADEFAANENTYFTAMRHYERHNYAYIELGDGDELWENRSFAEISAAHSRVFELLRRFYESGRLFMLYGNHDYEKKHKQGLLNVYYDETERRRCPLFPGIQVHEGLILRYRPAGKELFLCHGHQADPFNDSFRWLARFLVRYIWTPLQAVGIKAPAKSLINNKSADKTESRLMEWTERRGKMLIAGHTHRPRFPLPGETAYFNDGSCVHPRHITAIELSGGALRLVKWSCQTRYDGTLCIGRDVLSGPCYIRDYTKYAIDNSSRI